MRAKKFLALLLSSALVISLLPSMALTADAAGDPWSIADATQKTVYYTILDSSDQPTAIRKVTAYEDTYSANSANTIRIYVPEGANKRSPIAYIVNNSGWSSNGHLLAGNDSNLWGATSEDTAAKLYPPTHSRTNPGNDNYGAGKYAGQALEAGYVVVTAQLNSRSDYNHSPVTVGDAKAVIRYLRYNAANLPAGDVDYIIVSGMSGGGALTSAVASSGNSVDYLPYLSALGAAGITYNGNGSAPLLTNTDYMNYDPADFTDSLTDDVFAAVVYAPITDLSHADMAYGWTYLGARLALRANSTNGSANANFNAAAIEGSSELGNLFPDYVASLGLTYKGEHVNATFDKDTGEIGGVFVDAMTDLLKESIQFRIDNPDKPYYSGNSMESDMLNRTYQSAYSPNSDITDDWKTAWLSDTNNVDTFNLEDYLFWVAAGQSLKKPPAFDGKNGPTNESRNESNLYGLGTQAYNHVLEYTFKNDATTVGFYKGDAEGTADEIAQAAWEAYQSSGDYAKVQLQARMINSIPYLLDSEGDDQGDSAPHWYVRQGMKDRDSSFATWTLLYLSLLNADDVEDVDFRFTWDRAHDWEPYHDTPDAFEWVKATVDKAQGDPWSLEDNISVSTVSGITVDGKPLNVSRYEDYYLDANGESYFENAKVSIFVPETATADSPILYMVDNSGWGSDNYTSNSFGANLITGKDYNSTMTIGDDAYKYNALKNGYVLVSAGLRSRNDSDAPHSPVTVGDAKAVIRYLRYNDRLGTLPAGDTDHIVISGASGGGGLSVAVGASGNSSDYYAYLYDLGAAGIARNGTSDSYTYSSDLTDDVYAVAAYAPITDIDHADLAYSWTYHKPRLDLISKSTTGAPFGTDNAALSQRTIDMSAAFGSMFVDYVDTLGLKYNGKDVDATFDETTGAIGGTLKEAMEDLLKEGTQHRIDNPSNPNYQGTAMKDDMISTYKAGYDITTENAADSSWNTAWLSNLDDVGTFDLNAYLYWAANAGNGNSTLKSSPAFDGRNGTATSHISQNESNLFGLPGQLYNHVNEVTFKDDVYTIGLYDPDTNNAGTAWNEYVSSGDYNAVQHQGRMISPLPYLLDPTDVDSAPNWWVRWGMRDRDTSFAVETLLALSLKQAKADPDSDVDYVNFRFNWNVTHDGRYRDAVDFFEWLTAKVANEDGPIITFNPKGGSVIPSSTSTNATNTLNSLPTPTRSGYSFGGWYTAEADGTKVTASTVFDDNTVIYAYWNIITNTTGDNTTGGGSTTSNVTAGSTVNGTVTISQANPAKGDKVTVIVKPNSGYELGTLTLTDQAGTTVEYTDNGDGTYTFTYNGSPVTVNATFKEAVSQPGGTDPATFTGFNDVKASDWYAEAVAYAFAKGLMNGTGNGSFEPNTLTSRAMAVTILYRMAGSPAVSDSNGFSDLSQSWYKAAVQWAMDSGIANGVSDSLFAPDASITREQLAVLLYRYAQRMGYDVSKKADLSGYSDAGSISSFAAEAMAWANANGLITGVTNTALNPKGASSRAVVATVLMRFAENLTK